MKKRIMFLLGTTAILSSICLSAFANETITKNISDSITINISAEAAEVLNLKNANYCNVNKEENSIDYYNETDGHIKFIFNKEINLNDKEVADNMITAISNKDNMSVVHEHVWRLIGKWESESGQTGPLYYCEGCNTFMLG